MQQLNSNLLNQSSLLWGMALAAEGKRIQVQKVQYTDALFVSAFFFGCVDVALLCRKYGFIGNTVHAESIKDFDTACVHFPRVIHAR